MSRSAVLACIAALFAGLFTAGAASGADLAGVGSVISTATTTATNVVDTTTTTVTNVVNTTTTAVSTTTATATTPVITVAGTVPSVITTVTNAVTGVVTPAVTPPATGEAGGTVAGAVQGVTDALAAVTGASGVGESSGAPVSGAALNTLLTSVFGAASVNPSDKTAPKVTFKVLNRLKQATRTGKLKIRVITNEPSVVALSSALRAGRARRVHGKPLHLSRALLKTKPTVLAFSKAGNVTATIKLPASTRRSLANAQTARVALQAWATDVSRNQGQTNAKRTVRR